MLRPLIGAAIALLMTSVPSAAAPLAFVVDDGTSDNALGNFSGTPGDVLVVNQFDAGPGGAFIDTIAFVYGTPAGAGEPVLPVSVVLYDDLDDDGLFGMATLLFQSVAAVPAQAQNDVFNSVALPPTFVSGVFFVGVFAENVDDVGIVGQDTNDPAGPTAVFAGTALDLTDVLGTADIFAIDPESSGIALIRAFGQTVSTPAPAGIALFGLGAAALLLRRRR